MTRSLSHIDPAKNPNHPVSSGSGSKSGVWRPHPQRGFLPAADPLPHLPEPFKAWDQIAYDLPKLLVSSRVKQVVERLPKFETSQLQTDQQVARAMLVLSYLGHAYVWGEKQPAHRIPATLAVPWYEVSQRLGRPPVLSYESYALDNWRRMDPTGPIKLGNIALLQNFLGGIDEEWFILIHVDIEARAATVLNAGVAAQQAVAEKNLQTLSRQLHSISEGLASMNLTMHRMIENCDPFIYFNRVRPYIHGWKDNPALKNGLTYDGVEAYQGKPQKFRGETGAESSIVPSLDAVLGIAHADDPLRPYLLEMRDYMPPHHRNFIASLEAADAGTSSVRKSVLAHKDPSLTEPYNTCLNELATFRSTHVNYAASYIHSQRGSTSANPNAVGTGGTPFMPYLTKHRDETLKHQIG